MMKLIATAFFATLCVFIAASSFALATDYDAAADAKTVAAFEEKQIRCKVCERAIAYVWHEGVKLRSHCKSEERNDPRCDYANVHHFGIEEMVKNVCDLLPKTHKAIEGSEFDLIVHDDPQHTAENAAKIRNTCIRYVHDDMGLDNVALYLFANLDAGKHTDTILHSLVHRFCKRSCDSNFKLSRNVEDPAIPNARYRTARDRDSPNDL